MFSQTPVNTGRQFALDYAKGLAIIFMIICHTIMHISMGYRGTVAFNIGNSILGGPSTAPYFMICLGVGIVYSQRTSPLYLFKRGLKLLFGAYLLNLCRGGLTIFLLGALLGWSPEENGLDLDLGEECFYANMIVDILQFAGMAFLFFSLALWLKLKNWMLLALALVFQVISHFFEGYRAENEYVTALLGLIIPSGSIEEEDCLSCFPFLVWAIYPVVGYWFGQILQRVTDLNRFYRIIFWPTLVLSLIFIAILIIKGKMMPFSNAYYWHNLIEVFFYLCIDFCILAAFHLYSANLPQILFKPLTPFSRDITRMYCVSWCIIIHLRMVIQLVYDERGLAPIYTYILSVLVIVASYYIQKKFKKSSNTDK